MRHVLGGAVLLFVVACDKPEPGLITVAVDGVAGATGQLLISQAVDDNGNQAAVSCTPIDADPFSAEVPLVEINVGGTPCDPGDPIEVPPGLYDIQTVAMPGGGTPQQCADGQVEVDGDVTVDMPALGACD